MCSLAASSSALKAARPMRDPAISQIFGPAITAARQPGQRPDVGPCVLCIYSQADRFVYWPAVRRLPSANCPRCQRREAVGGHVALPEGRPTRTRPTAHCLPEPAARAMDSGRRADRPIRCDGVLHRRRPSADPVRAGAGPRALGAGRGGGARRERAHHCSHRLTCLTLNRSAGAKVPGRPGHVALPVTGPEVAAAPGGPPARDRHPCRGNPAPVILGQLLAFRADIRRLP
jgi:hypothetical protein